MNPAAHQGQDSSPPVIRSKMIYVKLGLNRNGGGINRHLKMFNHFGVWIISSFPIFYFHFRFFTHTIAHVTNGNLSNLCNVCCAFSVSISGTVHGIGAAGEPGHRKWWWGWLNFCRCLASWGPLPFWGCCWCLLCSVCLWNSAADR